MLARAIAEERDAERLAHARAELDDEERGRHARLLQEQDDLHRAVRPMLAVSNGRLICLSTPYGKRGFYHEAWANGRDDWARVEVPATRVARIPPEFLEEERRALGESWFRQEYLCSFEDTIDAVFSAEDIRAALSDDVKPLFSE